MRKSLLFIILMAAYNPLAAAPADAIVGHWMVASEDAIIRIFKAGNQYQGKLAWLQQDHYPANDARGIGGLPVMDLNNPDVTRQRMPLLGMTLLKGLRFDGDSLWRNGRIYNSENGKTYDCRVSLQNTDQLNLRGFFKTPLLGATTTWTRVEAPM